MAREKALIAPLPSSGSQGVNMAEYGMRGYLERTLALPKVPLLVQGTLLTPYVAADPSGALHLDALLSWATLQTYPVPLQWPAGCACTLPLPLALLDVVDGPEHARLPVWASGDLMPAGEALRDREYWHKRYPTDHAEWGKKLNADTGTGRWKEYRIPLSTTRTDRLESLCIGHAEEVLRLLDAVTHVGKKGTQGYGRVTNWTVTEVDLTPEQAEQLIRTQRPMPGQGGGAGGFTPPYNYRPWHTRLAAR